MFRDSGEEERTKFRKKRNKKKKKEKTKNLTAAKRGLVGMKGYFKTYNLVKYFAIFKSFSNKNAFYTKLLSWFSGP